MVPAAPVKVITAPTCKPHYSAFLRSEMKCFWNAQIVVCMSDLAVFQYPHELIWGEEKLTKGLAQHWWAQVLSGVGFSEGNNIRDTSRVHERSC